MKKIYKAILILKFYYKNILFNLKDIYNTFVSALSYYYGIFVSLLKDYYNITVSTLKERTFYDPFYLMDDVKWLRHQHLRIRLLFSIDHQDIALKYHENQLRVLREFGITSVASTLDKWWHNPNDYMIIVEDARTDKLVAGLRLTVADEIYSLPVEKAIKNLSPDIVARVHKFNHVIAEVCGMWINKEYSERNLALLMNKVALSIAPKLRIKIILSFPPKHTRPIFEDLGYTRVRIGNYALYNYPEGTHYVSLAMEIDAFNLPDTKHEVIKYDLAKEKLIVIKNKLIKNKITEEELIEDKIIKDKLLEDKLVEDKPILEELLKNGLIKDNLIQNNLTKYEFIEDKLTEDEQIKYELVKYALKRNNLIEDKFIKDELIENELIDDNLVYYNISKDKIVQDKIIFYKFIAYELIKYEFVKHDLTRDERIEHETIFYKLMMDNLMEWEIKREQIKREQIKKDIKLLKDYPVQTIKYHHKSVKKEADGKKITKEYITKIDYKLRI